MRVEAISIKNYRALRHVELTNIPPMSVFVGANGSGKSTLFDVFGFLHDALVHNVRHALGKRGGFREVLSRDAKGPIEIELKFRDDGEPLVTYRLEVGLDEEGQPVVEREVLKYRRGRRGQPWKFLDFTRGKGEAVTNEADYGKPQAEINRDEEQLDSPDMLAVKALGQFPKYRQVSALRRAIQDWQFDDFQLAAARPNRLCFVESPESHRYPTLREELAERFRAYAALGGQLFVTTYSPDFLNGVHLEEIFSFEKVEGFTRVTRLSEIHEIRSLVDEGDLPGRLWRHGRLLPRDRASFDAASSP